MSIKYEDVIVSHWHSMGDLGACHFTLKNPGHPADGAEAWMVDGLYHREDGPALIVPESSYLADEGRIRYYLDGKKFLSEEELKLELESRMNREIKELVI